MQIKKIQQKIEKKNQIIFQNVAYNIKTKNKQITWTEQLKTIYIFK